MTEKPPRYFDLPELAVAIIEHMLEPIVGKAAIQIVKDPVEQKRIWDSYIEALTKANDKFIESYTDKDKNLVTALSEMAVVNLPSILTDLFSFCDNPTNTAFQKNLSTNLHSLKPNENAVNIDNAVKTYMDLLRAEIVASANEAARSKLTAMNALEMREEIARISSDVEQIMKIISRKEEVPIQDVLVKSSRMLDNLIPPPVSLPINIDFSENVDDRKIYTPPFAHRRVVDNVLEFGSRIAFDQSWACLGNICIPYFDLEFEAAFRNAADDGWIGVGFRSQSYYANFEHLLYLKLDGAVLLTQPNEIPPNFYADEMLRPPTEIDKTGFHHFHVQFTSDKLVLSVDDFSVLKEVAKLPKVFGPGRIMFQAWPSWMAIKRIKISIQDGPKRPHR